MKTTDTKHLGATLSVEIDHLIEVGLLPLNRYVTIETINPIYHGKLIAVTPSYYFIEHVSWLGDVGQRSEYESGTAPVEANNMGDRVIAVERSGVLLMNTAHDNLQKHLSPRNTTKK